MKKFKKLSFLLSFILIFSTTWGNVGLPVLAYENDGVNFEQVKTETTFDNSGVIFNKINFPAQEIKSFSPGSSVTKKEMSELVKYQQIEGEKKNYVEGEVLVKYKTDRINLNTSLGRTDVLNFISSNSLEKKEDLVEANISLLKIKDDKTVEGKISELKNNSNVEYAQPNFQYYPADINTNDTNRGLLWGLDNTGQTVGGTYTTNNPGSADKDIDAPEAWEINEGTNASTTIVAVIDFGVAYNHPDLINNMWNGTNCVDEDGSPLGGCQHGYDFEDNDKIPLPTYSSHGTHIAGTIAATKGNGLGIIGVAPQAKIMVLKSSLTTADNVKSINFAKQNGAKVINASWGCYGSDQGGTHAVCRGSGDYRDLAMISAIESFPGLFITAAGNGDGDTDIDGDNHDGGQTLHNYPCDHTADNIICVAATDQNDALATFSDYGVISVDVGAPGTNIYSTVADSNIFSENFEGSVYNIETGGLTTSHWGVEHDGNSKVAYSDKNVPYAASAHTWLISNPIDLSNNNIKGATLSFTIWCDTPSSATFDDYILTEHFSNGAWSISAPYDEDKIRSDGGYSWVDSGYVGYYKNYTENISDHLSSDFAFAFIWNTNSSIDHNLGCTIDDIKVTKYSDGSDEQYGYMDGTSMAAPHVAGLAGLLWGYKPELSYSEVKDSILRTGDALIFLSGQTSTGKRINAANALNSIIPPVISGLQTASTTATSTIVNWTTDELATSKVAYSTSTPVTSTIVSSSTLATIHSLELTNLTASTTYHYYVESADEYGNIATSTEQLFTTNSELDATAPILFEVTPIATSTNDNTPDYTFNSDEAGSITYGGSCSSSSSTASIGDNTIIFNELIDDTYTNCTITVTDAASNTSDLLQISTFTIDTIPPVITLIGSSTIDIYVGDVYEDKGANASDTINGDITANIVTVNPVDTSVAGTYTITYDVSDAAGNAADQVIRTVNVLEVPDTEPPVITSFIIPETSDSLTVPITTFEATDHVGITGYLLTETSTIPSLDDPNWSVAILTSYTFSGEGTKALYAWAKDAANNISTSLNDSVTITFRNITNVSSLDDINETYGTPFASLSLPEIVEVTLTDTSTTTLQVTWAEGTYDSNVAGEYTLEGDIILTPEISNSNNLKALVKVIVSPNTAKVITSFKFESLSPEVVGIINETDHTVLLTVPYGIDVTNLVPTILVSDYATSTPASSIAQDFANPITYIVTAEDGSTQDYIVTVASEAPPTTTTTTTTPPATGGGGGGGGGYTPPPTTTTTKPQGEVKGAATEKIKTVEELQQLLNQLIKQLQSLLVQLVQSGKTIPPGLEKYLAGVSLIQAGKVSDISRDLYSGLQGEDVKLLQSFLINQKKGSKSISLSSYGPTGYFGSVTRSALAEYQANVGIKPAVGYFGPITRNYLKSIGY